MKYFTINSFVETLKEQYPKATRFVLIFATKALTETPYRSKQGMPLIIKVFNPDGEEVLKFDDIVPLFDEDFSVSFKLPVMFKDQYVCVDIDTTPVWNEKIDAMYYNRVVRKIGNKTLKVAHEEFRKQKPRLVKQAIDGEPFDI